MKYPVPVHITQQISNRAAQLAKSRVQGYGWSNKSIHAIHPQAGHGTVGLQTTVKYLMYQDRGIRPFIMSWVNGRLIPIDGHVVRGKGAGTPGWVYIPGRGRVWRAQRWRHPGLSPRRFLEDSITEAINEARPQLQQMLMGILKGNLK